MGTEYRLYCIDCKASEYLGKSYEMAYAAVESVKRLKKEWDIRMISIEKYRYRNAKAFCVQHTEKGHKVLVVEE